VLRATWIDFQVGGDAVRVDDRLEDIGELVGLVVGGRRLFRLHAVQYRRHAAAAALLRHKRGRSKFNGVTEYVTAVVVKRKGKKYIYIAPLL